MIINAAWLFLFQVNTSWGFVLSLIDIIAMLVSNVYIMGLATTNKVDTWEWIGLRAGFSIYTGWLTAATILTAAFTLKSLGVSDTQYLANIPYLTEESITVGVLWVAFVIYNLVAWTDRNPLYGSVFIWAILAIR